VENFIRERRTNSDDKRRAFGLKWSSTVGPIIIRTRLLGGKISANIFIQTIVSFLSK